MPTNNLWAGALSQLLIHQESGCPHSARHAIRLLDQLCDFDNLDDDVRVLCERASHRLGQSLSADLLPGMELCHAHTAP